MGLQEELAGFFSWFYLSVCSVSIWSPVWYYTNVLPVRIIGGSLHIASENSPSNINLRIAYAILEGAGLSPLLIATIGFLQTM